MKTIVFSDSHGDIYTMECIIDKFLPNMVIFLGDGINDVNILIKKYPAVSFAYVRGNCDEGSTESNEKIINIGDIKAFITHGDSFGHGFDIGGMISSVKEKGVKLIMSGHTHTPTMSFTEGILYLNPGSIRRTFIDGSFGLIESEGTEFSCKTMYTKVYLD